MNDLIELDDNYYMGCALAEGRKAAACDEIPVGAVIVTKSGRIIGRGHNMTEALSDVTAHAEIQAITAAAQSLGGKYLVDCTLYVTVEPCLMCAGAIGWSQLRRIVIGCADDKTRLLDHSQAQPLPPTCASHQRRSRRRVPPTHARLFPIQKIDMHYFIIAGEASGDLHGAALIDALRTKDSQARFDFLGGDMMTAAAGCEPIIHYRRMAFMGFSEVLRHLSDISANMKRTRQAIAELHPDCIILIDYPSFNLKVAAYAKKSRHPRLLLHLAQDLGLETVARKVDTQARAPRLLHPAL